MENAEHAGTAYSQDPKSYHIQQLIANIHHPTTDYLYPCAGYDYNLWRISNIQHPTSNIQDQPPDLDNDYEYPCTEYDFDLKLPHHASRSVTTGPTPTLTLTHSPFTSPVLRITHYPRHISIIFIKYVLFTIYNVLLFAFINL